MESIQTNLNQSYNVGFTLAQHQNNLRVFLKATVVLILAGRCDIIYFLKRAPRLETISFFLGLHLFFAFHVTLCNGYHYCTILFNKA